MNIFKALFKPLNFSTANSAAFVEFVRGATTTTLELRDATEAYYAYTRCPQLGFAVNKRAEAVNNAELELLKSNGDYYEGSDKEQFSKIYTKPNDYQSGSEFIELMEIYSLLFGYCIIYCDGVIGSQKYKSKAFHIIPPVGITPLYSSNDLKNINTRLRGFNASVFGLNFMPIEQCIIIKDNVPDINNRFLPCSRLAQIAQLITNTIIAYEIYNVSMKDRGAVGIISSKVKDIQATIMPKLQEEIKNVKEQYYGNYGLTEGKSPLIFSNTNLGFDRIAWDVKDMMLFDGIEEATERIFDALQVPLEIASMKNGATYTNKTEARKGFYTETVIPNATARWKQLSNELGLTSKGVEIAPSFEHIDVLQKSEKEKAEGKKALSDAFLPLYEKGIITKNQLLYELGYDEVSDGNKYFEQ